MIWFLVGTSLLFAWLKDFVEATVLAAAVLPLLGMDAYLHRRTQASTEGLAGRLSSTATVVRDGEVTVLRAVDLVPGDLAIVAEGESFPADGLIVEGRGLLVDESALTGEAVPVSKAPFPGLLGAAAEVSADALHWGMAGTRLLTQTAMLRVVYTGSETLYGEIVRSAQAGRHARTPLQRAIASLVLALVLIAILACVALAVVRLRQGHGIVDAVVSAVTLAVAALPEEFPVVFAFFLGVGVYRLARVQALVRRAVVVENIGRVTCICSDKTGTLTEGRLRLVDVVPAPGVTRERLLEAAAATSRAESGDPLDQAVLATARARGARVATFPFTEDRRREVAVIHDADATPRCLAKGAPETILEMTDLSPGERASWRVRSDELASSGRKVIACAGRVLEAWTGDEPVTGYAFLGLITFQDPVRDGVVQAVAQAQAAGIRVVMVTGDYPATARAISCEIGLGRADPRVIRGEELSGLVASRGLAALRDFDVVARATPAQKTDLVKALQSAGEIVLVTGDGVNDVPALQAADIGVAMGERGTRAAREVAAIVLLDDNFRTIVRAVAEGRQLFTNLRLSFAYLLMMQMPLVISAAFVPFAGYPLLYLPVHIVWLELIVHPTSMLVFQQIPSAGALAPGDRRAEFRVFGGLEWLVIAVIGMMISVAVIAGYDFSLGAGRDVDHARAMALVSFVVASAMITAGLSRLRTKTAQVVAGAVVGSAVLFAQTPGLAALLHLNPLHLDDWMIATAGGLAAGALSTTLPYVEAWRSRLHRRRAAS